MKGLIRRAAPVAALATLTGCPEAPRVIVTAKSINAVDPAAAAIALPKEPAPAASDPAAVALVKAAVAAHTGGNPSLLERAKSFRFTRRVEFRNGVTPPQRTWKSEGVWPDRSRIDDETDPVARTTLCRNGPAGWMAAKGPNGLQKQTLSPAQLRELMADSTYEWLAVLVPLIDPGLTATPFAERTVLGKPAVGVRLAGPNLPSAVVHFDAETKLMVQFSYEGIETGKPTTKEVAVRSYRDVNGIKMPEKFGSRWDGQPTLEWELLTLEFPVEFPQKTWDEP